MYNSTTEHSPLRNLHIDLLLESHNFATWLLHREFQPKDFIIDLFEACRERQIVSGGAEELERVSTHLWIKDKAENFCENYHDHQELEPRPILTSAQ